MNTSDKIKALCLGILLPGGGQIYSGRRFKAASFMLSVGAAFFIGVLLIDRTSENSSSLIRWWLNLITGEVVQTGTFGVVLAFVVRFVLFLYPLGTGLSFFIIGALLDLAGVSFHQTGAMIKDISFCYLITAALINVLALLDATRDFPPEGEA